MNRQSNPSSGFSAAAVTLTLLLFSMNGWAVRDGCVNVLKAAFLDCDQAATVAAMDSNAAAHCSVIYEALKSEGFEGDWQRLHSWWRTQPRVSARAAVNHSEALACRSKGS